MIKALVMEITNEHRYMWSCVHSRWSLNSIASVFTILENYRSNSIRFLTFNDPPRIYTFGEHSVISKKEYRKNHQLITLDGETNV